MLLGFCYNYFLQFVEGSPIMSIFIRLLGGKCGNNLYWEGHVPTEVKNISIGSDVIVNNAMILGHVVDNNRLQFGEIAIADRVALNFGVLAQPGSNIGVGVTVGCNSLVVKGEHLPPNSHWSGVPLVMVQTDVNMVLKSFARKHQKGKKKTTFRMHEPDSVVIELKVSSSAGTPLLASQISPYQSVEESFKGQTLRRIPLPADETDETETWNFGYYLW